MSYNSNKNSQRENYLIFIIASVEREKNGENGVEGLW